MTELTASLCLPYPSLLEPVPAPLLQNELLPLSSLKINQRHVIIPYVHIIDFRLHKTHSIHRLYGCRWYRLIENTASLRFIPHLLIRCLCHGFTLSPFHLLHPDTYMSCTDVIIITRHLQCVWVGCLDLTLIGNWHWLWSLHDEVIHVKLITGDITPNQTAAL